MRSSSRTFFRWPLPSRRMLRRRALDTVILHRFLIAEWHRDVWVTFKSSGVDTITSSLNDDFLPPSQSHIFSAAANSCRFSSESEPCTIVTDQTESICGHCDHGRPCSSIRWGSYSVFIVCRVGRRQIVLSYRMSFATHDWGAFDMNVTWEKPHVLKGCACTSHVSFVLCVVGAPTRNVHTKRPHFLWATNQLWQS